jgi:hypothetical protein
MAMLNQQAMIDLNTYHDRVSLQNHPSDTGTLRWIASDIMKENAGNQPQKVLKTDYESLIDVMHRLDRIMVSTFAKHENILDWYYNNLHEKIFAKVSKKCIHFFNDFLAGPGGFEPPT